MFEGSLVESRGRVASKAQRWSAAGSFIFQCAGAALLVAVPMLRPVTMPVKIAAQSEANLPGHLPGEAPAKKAMQVIKPAPGKKYDDFQLSYALDVMRGKNTVAFVKSAAAD